MVRVQKQNSSRAFALLVQRWERPLQRFCSRMTGDLHRGEDLAQEAFARLFAHRQQFRHDARFSTFLWRIALNLCYDHRRREKRRSVRGAETLQRNALEHSDELATSEPTPEARLVQEERAGLVRGAVSRLPESHRSIVVLRHYQGLKFREIAEVTKMAEGTVKYRMAEALTWLGRWLQPAFGDEAAPAHKTFKPEQPKREETRCPTQPKKNG